MDILEHPEGRILVPVVPEFNATLMTLAVGSSPDEVETRDNFKRLVQPVII